jgi:hypothetical protein
MMASRRLPRRRLVVIGLLVLLLAGGAAVFTWLGSHDEGDAVQAEVTQLRPGTAGWVGELRVGLVSVRDETATMQAFIPGQEGMRVIKGGAGETLDALGRRVLIVDVGTDASGAFVDLEPA